MCDVRFRKQQRIPFMEKAALYDGLSRQLVDLHASMARMQDNLERAMDVSKKTHRMSHAFLGVYVVTPMYLRHQLMAA
ncbi:hypothetical protein DYB25_013492 [Aphanomyces astaci]|uniref:Uncharacterized protein n=1 Tax=Aphanomyces astaci TaxID=112090 RepID=A0A397ASR1_APHAT|nr:hypothetical protein DYB36_008597 [Aphanomyces astaci]RHY10702.1 hypothetical protein DYB25_013492 [Aphanomyces astaci]RHY76789.1 hypothetical protein DYB30_013729 [Aphanomyces astaci]